MKTKRMSLVTEKTEGQQRSWFTAQAGADAAVAEIAIYDEIGLWGVSASDFNTALRALGAVSQINLRINSPGGSVFDGLAIYNMLRRHRARVVVTIDGVAASMASVVAMAGDTVAMPSNAMMMIHDPAGVAVGTSKEMRELAAVLDKVKAGLISAYVAKSGADEKAIAKLMTAETWLSAEEALELGFVDQIEDAVQLAASFNLSRRFRRAPEGLSARNEETSMSNTPNPAPAAAPAAPVAPAPAAPEALAPAAPVAPAAPAAPVEPVAPVAPVAAAPAGDDPVAAERQRAADVVSACALANRAADAPGFIAEGKTLSEVLTALAASRRPGGMRGGADGASPSGEISARHGGSSQDGAPLRVDLAADMRRRVGVTG